MAADDLVSSIRKGERMTASAATGERAEASAAATVRRTRSLGPRGRVVVATVAGVEIAWVAALLYAAYSLLT
jgi:hypothetical protein